MNDFFNASQFEPASESKAGSTDSNQNILVHASLSQIVHNTSREESLVISGQKISTVVTIGVVINVEELTTKNIYTIEDYTNGSPIEVQLWKNDNNDGGQIAAPTVMERTYIRVTGQARYDEIKPFIVAFRVETIQDPNDIYCHFLQVIHDSFYLEKLMKETNLEKNDGNGFDNNQAPKLTGFSEIQRGVLNILNKYGRDSPYGLKRYEIRNYMSGVNHKSIDDAINFLVNEGHIFSTTDDDTFKSTDY